VGLVILFEVIAAGLVLSLVTGGSLRRLEQEHLAGEWILLVLLPVQVFWPRLSEAIGLPCAASMIIWLLMMAALAGVLFWNAPRRWMLAFAGLGIAMNVLVIGVNGAMPVSLKAAAELGQPYEATQARLEVGCLHRALDDETKLVFLADVIPVPGPSWHAGVVSVGDLLLAGGLGVWVFRASRRA
jgi:hypothetical protein